MYGQARQFAESWLELIRVGRLYEAHQLTLKEAMRASAGVSLDEVYRKKNDHEHDHAHAGHSHSKNDSEMMENLMEQKPPEMFETFFHEPVMQRMRDLGRDAHYRFRGNLQVIPSGPISELVEMVFDVTEPGSSKSFPILISLERQFDIGVADWNVVRVVAYNPK
jgi:hypothetical protein